MEVLFGAFSSGLRDVANCKKDIEDKENECKDAKGGGDGEKKEAYDSAFVEVVGGGDELKDFIGVCFVLLFLYRFGFCLVSDTLFYVFVLRVIRNCLKILVLITTLKIVMLKMVMKH